MKRRSFLKTSVLAGASLLAERCAPTGNVPEDKLSTPVLVVGSGFGGSVTALRLAQAGIPNILLERGRSWHQHDFCSFSRIDERSTWLNSQALIPIINARIPLARKYTGVIEYHTSPNMSIFNAAGLGGGSLVFGATYVQPERSVFNRVFPAEVDFDDMENIYFPRVQQEVQFSHIPDDIYQSLYYQYARTFYDQVSRAGKPLRRLPASYDWDIIRREMNGEIPLEFLKGDGNYGTRNGSKYSLDKTYIARAEATGKTRVMTLTNVVNISRSSDQKYLVQAERLSETGQVLERLTIQAERLFLCAGAPNTVKLLLKAKLTSNLTALNDRIGKGFGTNGKTFFRRTVPEATGPLTGWTPAAASPHYTNPHVPILIENIPQPIGLILPVPDLKSHFHVGLGATTYRGSFDYDADRDRLVLNWDKHGLDESIAAAKDWCEQMNAANPGTYTDTVLIQNMFANNLSYHPLGGCVMGDATDLYGRLPEYPNLYVNDSTLIPGTTACANPAFTIAAIAERNISRILAEDF